MTTASDARQMTDDELAALLAAHEDQAVAYYTSDIASEQERAIDYYYGRMDDLPSQPGRSSVVDRTVAIVADNAVAALMKPFVSADDAVMFEPRGPEDEEAAQQATEYVNYVFHVDNRGFLLMHNWFKAACLEKLGVVKVWWEDRTATKVERLEGLDPLTLEALMQSEKVAGGPYQDETGFSIDVERTDEDGRCRIATVSSEEFRISPYARDIETAEYTAHIPLNLTRSDLIEMGFDPEIVDGLPAATADHLNDSRSQARYQDEEFGSGRVGGSVGNDKARDLVAFRDECAFIDYDGDGVAERRRIMRVDDTILYNEEVDDNCFAVLCPIPMPNKVYGLSLADQSIEDQRLSTAIWRQTLDNLYLSNNPKTELPEAAAHQDGRTHEALMDAAPGGVVETRTGGLINPLAVPFVADKSFPMLEFIDVRVEQKTGIRKHGQGLDPDSLNKGGQITATQAAQMEEGGNTRIELIARIFAETGVKRLFRLILKHLIKHQPKARMIRLRNQWVEMDPRAWNAEMDLAINVGLGVGNKMSQIAQSQSVLEALNGLGQTPYGYMIKPQGVYDGFKRLLNASGVKNVDNYLKEPQEGEEPPQQPSPEMMKIQSEQQRDQAKLQLEGQKAAAQLQQSEAESVAKIDLMREEAAAKLQLEREKAALEAELAREKIALEAELAREKMTVETRLAEENAKRQHEIAMKTADAKIASNRPGGSLAE